MISLNDVLLAAANIPVDDPIAEIWGQQMQGGYKIIEYTGTLPIAINADGNVVIDYRIYGASGGVGEPTESGEPAGCKLPMMAQSANLFDKNAENTDNGFVAHAYLDDRNNVVNYYNYNVSEYISIKPSTDYYAQNVSYASVSYCSTCFYTADYTFISGISYAFKVDVPFTTPANAAYARMSIRRANLDILTLIEGTEPPSEYIPYSKQTIPIYIGENQLVENEYVSYGEQKIYRDINGTLTPTDPSVPLPEIPTIDGTTVIDYDGEPKPSQMYIKYNGKR